jgi:hypothetical protein
MFLSGATNLLLPGATSNIFLKISAHFRGYFIHFCHSKKKKSLDDLSSCDETAKEKTKLKMNLGSAFHVLQTLITNRL